MKQRYEAGAFNEEVEADDREAIREKAQELGFRPTIIIDPPGRIYGEHRHPTDKLLVFLSGSMQVQTGGAEYDCRPGDMLIIPGGLTHSAQVGEDGCEFFWSEVLHT